MRPEDAIEVEHVTKRFDLARNAGSLKTAVLDLVRRRPHPTLTALSDVSFNVARGETLGLIGANGAGKSTMLSIIARTMAPTEGEVRTRGVVSSLLELGAGFHPDLTGTENVYLYGAIMGIPRETMRRRYDAIVEFSGLKDFMGQPVRHYSSGMYVRLGFAVAVQVDPDILLIDEVLAVGDADFQRRCLEKMADFRRRGKSMLIISHDMHTIRKISDRIAYLDHGVLKSIGSPMETSAAYGADSPATASREWGTGEARLAAVSFLDAAGRDVPEPPPGEPLRLRIAWSAPAGIERPTFGFSVTTPDNQTVFGTNTELMGFDIPEIRGTGELRAEIDARALHPGDYLVSFALHSRDHAVNYHRLDNRLRFHVEGDPRFEGPVALPCRFSR